MNQPSSLPPAAAPQPTDERSTSGAPEQAAPGISDLAAVPLSDLFQRLHSSEAGLSASGAADILAAVGPNRIETAPRKSLLADFIGRFRNPLVFILLFAAVVSGLTGDIPSFVIITVIILMSVILDVTQERRAVDAAERLRVQVSPKAKTLRDGKPVDLPAAEIVPGDVVLLAAGDLVPADSRLIEARDIYVDEALLTGEAYPAEKNVAPATAAARARPPSHQSRLHGKLGGERNRQGVGPGDRPQSPTWLDRPLAAKAAAADCL